MSILPSELWNQELEAMLLHIQQAEELLSIVHRKPVSSLVVSTLLWLERKFGRDDQGRLIDLSITHRNWRRD